MLVQAAAHQIKLCLLIAPLAILGCCQKTLFICCRAFAYAKKELNVQTATFQVLSQITCKQVYIAFQN